MTTALFSYQKEGGKMILYFTGTGNSRHAAIELSKMLQDSNVVDIGAMIKDGEKGDFHSEKSYIFVVPTYAWRMPRIVSDFISKSKFDVATKAYFVLTCGDSIGNAEKYAKKLCTQKGLDFAGCAKVKMPENYIALYDSPDVETSQRLIESAEETLTHIAKTIASGEELKIDKSKSGAIESSVVNSVFYSFIVKDRGFRTTDECTSCGLCQEVCVLNNVKIVDGKPKWSGNCTHCMACICRCPEEAIEYKETSKGKRRYYLD